MGVGATLTLYEGQGQKAVPMWLPHSPGQQGIKSGAEMTQLPLISCLSSSELWFSTLAGYMLELSKKLWKHS